MVTLIHEGWGKPGSAFIRAFASIFIPDGSKEQLDSVADLQRLCINAETAARLRWAIDGYSVAGRLGGVSVPTLVLHVRHDAVHPFEQGGRLLRVFRGLDSCNSTAPITSFFRKKWLGKSFLVHSGYSGDRDQTNHPYGSDHPLVSSTSVCAGRRAHFAARSSVAMSILPMLRKVSITFGSGDESNCGRCWGMICHDRPKRSFSQPQRSASGTDERACQ